MIESRWLCCALLNTILFFDIYIILIFNKFLDINPKEEKLESRPKSVGLALPLFCVKPETLSDFYACYKEVDDISIQNSLPVAEVLFYTFKVVIVIIHHNYIRIVVSLIPSKDSSNRF
ncbi:hypothetical protein ACJX0J_024265 [Zea mays]